MSLFQSNLRKQIRNLPKILNFVKIIHYYSKLFTGVLTQAGQSRARAGRAGEDRRDGGLGGRHADLPAGAEAEARQRRQRASVGKISAKCCSFSAVSAPIFARKYAFCSIFQNLPDSQAEIFEI